MSEPRAGPETRPASSPVAMSDRSTEGNRTGSWKYIRPEYRDLVSPCREGCPTGVDIEGYLGLLGEGRLEDAAALLLRENPMPAITGRVCDHPCERRCSRARLDGALAIHAIERWLGDRILDGPPPRPVVSRPYAVAVVGSGPAGLACAYHLARQGYAVDVFERASEAGGMLRQGIPSYRLPRDVLDRQLEWLRGAGVRIRCGAAIGREALLGLLAGFDAVFLATGAHAGRPLGLPGENLRGVRQGLAFLREVNRGARPELGRRVVVVGGGNTAMDCARVARRGGAEVTVVYRRTREDMPAIAAEVEEALAEGVAFRFLAAPTAFLGDDGVRAVRCVTMEPGEPDASGRRRPVPSGDPPFDLRADSVLTAVGEDVATGFLPAELRGPGQVTVDDWGATGVGLLFAGGDVAGDPRTVATALGAGKRAAVGIDRLLRERAGDPGPWLEPGELRPAGGLAPAMTRWRGDDPVRRVRPANRVVKPDAINLAHFAPVPGVRRRRRTPADLTGDFGEVEIGLQPDQALREAARCFRCGVCDGCEVCLISCPDVAIHRAGNGVRFLVDLDHCKGCGICAAECPRGAVEMVREAP